MKEIHYLIYKTTNLINGKIYIGQHKTKNLNDGYIGSGIELRKAIELFGIDNFKTEILFDFDNFKDMDDKERELVNEEFVAREDTYNIIPGGLDEIHHVCGESRARANRTRWKNLSKEQRKHYMEAAKLASTGRHRPMDERKRISSSLKMTYKQDPSKKGMLGKHHSKESKHKMSLSHRGKKNNQYGKMWICNDETKESIIISKNDPIPKNWRKGRFCKKCS